MVGPAENELAREYRIREPYTARRRETRGRKQGDGNGRMEKGRKEKEKGKQQGTDVMSLNRIVCAQQDSEFHRSPHVRYFSRPVKDTERHASIHIFPSPIVHSHQNVCRAFILRPNHCACCCLCRSLKEWPNSRQGPQICQNSSPKIIH